VPNVAAIGVHAQPPAVALAAVKDAVV